MSVDKKALTCPYCHYEFPLTKSGIKWIGWVLVLLMLALFIYNYLKK